MSRELEGYARAVGISVDEVVARVRALHADPVAWIEAATGSTLWERQREIVLSALRNRVTCVPSCNGGGKSFAAAAVNVYAVNNVFNFLGITTAPTDRQVNEILWTEINRVYAAARLPLAGKPDTKQLKISEEQRLLGFVSKDYDQNVFQGIRALHTLITLDEACGISPVVYEGAYSIISAGQGRLLQLSNPVDPTSKFASECKRRDAKVIQISAYDAPNFNIPGAELRERNFTCDHDSPDFWKHVLHAAGHFDWSLNDGHGECVDLPSQTTNPQFVHDVVQDDGPGSVRYIARVLGRFPDSAENSLFTASEIEDAQRSDLSLQAREQPFRIGVDVARMGHNVTVVAGCQGPQLRILGAWEKQPTTETARRVAAIAAQCARAGLWPEEVAVDVIGVGGGVVDQLREMRIDWGRGPMPFPVVEFNSSSTDGIPDNVENHRGHAYLSLAKRAERRELDLPTHRQLHGKKLGDELLTIRKDIADTNGKTRILGKKWMRENGFDSPDFADAAAIAAYAGPRGSRDDCGITI